MITCHSYCQNISSDSGLEISDCLSKCKVVDTHTEAPQLALIKPLYIHI